MADLTLLGLLAAAIGFLTGAVKLWQWGRGRSSAYRLLLIALLGRGLRFTTPRTQHARHHVV